MIYKISKRFPEMNKEDTPFYISASPVLSYILIEAAFDTQLLQKKHPLYINN